MPKRYRYKVKLIQMSNGRKSLAKDGEPPAINGEGIFSEDGSRVTVGFLNFTRIKGLPNYGGAYRCDESKDEYRIECGKFMGEYVDPKPKKAIPHEVGYAEKMKQKVSEVPFYHGGAMER